jgi:hypothetical protein
LSSRCSTRLEGSVVLLALVGLPALGGCAASPAQRAAERGDRAALHAAIAAREKTGDLSNGDAADLARAVAERDVREATGANAIDRVRDARACAHELDGALSARMGTRDAAGAQAALARLDAGGLSFEDARAEPTTGDPAWRAVVARALVRPLDREARLRALLDPDPVVRRAAARAARDALDPGDIAPLAEAARLDPEPIVRTEAVRGLAALGGRAQGASAGALRDALRDLWGLADDGLREDIARAWSGDPLWGSGGRDALLLLVSSDHGPGAVEGAAAVLRRGDADAEVVGASLGQLARAIESGPRGARLQAIAQAPLERRELLEVVQKAAAGEDVEVRVAALGRLASGRASAAAAGAGPVEQLETLARPGSKVARRARSVLAVAGDRRVQAWIEEDLGAAGPEERLAAASDLAAMGVAARGAPLLADANAGVRVRAACTLIGAARGPWRATP